MVTRPWRIVLAAFVAATLAAGGCLHHARRSPAPALIEGRVVLGEEGLAGAPVGAYARPDFRPAPVAAAVTGKEGFYRLEVPPGTWYLAVNDMSRGYFAYAGLNPLRVPAGAALQVGLRAGRAVEAGRRESENGITAVTGRLTSEGRPLPGARVFLYLDAAEDFRGPGYAFSQPADGEGRFLIEDIPPGTYFLIGRRRLDDRLVGPVEGGDYFGYFPFNPVELRGGETLEVEIPLAEKKKELFPSAGATVLEGTVREGDGRPAAGVYVFAYTEEVVGHKMPAATSPPTGAEGRFTLTLPRGGTYYLGAREKYGVNPQPGERYGLYPGAPDHSLTVADGERLEGIDLIVEKVLGWEQ